MGSSCSILNDTSHDVWITHGINWTVLLATVGGVGVLATGGAALAAAGAAAGVGGALLGGGAMIMAEGGIIMGIAPATIAGLTATGWTVVGAVTNLATGTLALTLNITEPQAEALKAKVTEFQENSELIRPGEKYTWTGTLSLTKTVYVMNDKLQSDNLACFTGPTAGSENVYPISEYFKNLDVK